MIGYKVFNPDWTCRGFQYEVGRIYEEDVVPSCCNRGFHFCKTLVHCFNYYSFNPENKVAEIETLGDVDVGKDKCCTNKIKIVRELSWEEVLRQVNTGYSNTGFCNSGNRNSGNRNSGDYNSGYGNSGNHNSGNYNSGDWNKASFSSGCFNTYETKIYLFNKLSEWTLRDWMGSDARSLLQNSPLNNLKWVTSDSMTGAEKELHPEHQTIGGYLREIAGESAESAQKWWNSLSDKDKYSIMSIPNFNAEIFKEITGIKVN